MPRKAKELTIKELQAQLAAKERQLKKLQAARKKLTERLAEIDAEIAAIGGPTTGKPRAVKVRRKRRAAGKAPRRKVKRSRAKGRPLGEYLVDVLKNAPDGMRIKDLVTAVLESGYKTRSKDFYGIVASALRDDKRFKNIRRGVYALA